MDDATGPPLWADAVYARRAREWDEQAPYNRFRDTVRPPEEPAEDIPGVVRRGGFRRPIDPAD